MASALRLARPCFFARAAACAASFFSASSVAAFSAAAFSASAFSTASCSADLSSPGKSGPRGLPSAKGSAKTSRSTACVTTPSLSLNVTRKVFTSRAMPEVSASPRTTHLDGHGSGSYAMTMNGLPGSGMPQQETVMRYRPDCFGCHVTIHVPFIVSVTRARTCETPRIAIKNSHSAGA